MKRPHTKCILCGYTNLGKIESNYDIIRLSYYDNVDQMSNISIELSKFVQSIDNLPDRIKDLLEIATYIFSADRAVSRGERDSLGYNCWARTFEFHIPVRDIKFWNNDKLISDLSNLLTFMTGDRSYKFIFCKYENGKLPEGNEYIQQTLFRNEYIMIEEANKTNIMLFSGGLDSLAGAIDFLAKYKDQNLCLVSHESNGSVMHTQTQLVKALKKKYGNRIKHYKFKCTFKNGKPSRDETQRTRMFLFASIAYAICSSYKKHEFYVFENGIVSINLPKQADIMNARASRTTHPKTIALMQLFLKNFDREFIIKTPFFLMTKRDIIQIFKKTYNTELISSSVSCSSMRNKPMNALHCGCCSQCIDRRFAIFSACLDEYDSTYAADFVAKIPDSETKQRLYNTLRMAAMEGTKDSNDFFNKYPNELMDVLEFMPGDNVDDKLYLIFDLYCRYSESILDGVKKMQVKYEDLLKPTPHNSLLEMVANRDYLQSPIRQRVEQINDLLKSAIPTMFQREKPKNENDFNDKVEAILESGQGKFKREYPIIRFGLANYIPDHSQENLLIESKYIRGSTSPSVITSGIAEDITKAPKECGLMFIVYDPDRRILNDEKFAKSFESTRDNCYVNVYQ